MNKYKNVRINYSCKECNQKQYFSENLDNKNNIIRSDNKFCHYNIKFIINTDDNIFKFKLSFECKKCRHKKMIELLSSDTSDNFYQCERCENDIINFKLILKEELIDINDEINQNENINNKKDNIEINEEESKKNLFLDKLEQNKTNIINNYEKLDDILKGGNYPKNPENKNNLNNDFSFINRIMYYNKSSLFNSGNDINQINDNINNSINDYNNIYNIENNNMGGNINIMNNGMNNNMVNNNMNNYMNNGMNNNMMNKNNNNNMMNNNNNMIMNNNNNNMIMNNNISHINNNLINNNFNNRNNNIQNNNNLNIRNIPTNNILNKNFINNFNHMYNNSNNNQNVNLKNFRNNIPIINNNICEIKNNINNNNNIIKLTFINQKNENEKYFIDASLEMNFNLVICNVFNKYENNDIDFDNIKGFSINGRKIFPEKSVKENGIKDGDIIIINY